MELPTHPLLTLVECNANCLKSMLTSYIDATVDNQFASLRNSIETMIQYGQIGPQKNHHVTEFGTTLPPPTQANTDQSSAQCLHEYSNDTLTRALEHKNSLQNEVSNTINTDGLMIKQEFGDDDEGDGEEIDDNNVENCEKCEKGICNSVRENYDYTDMGENGDKQNVNTALENNQMNQSINSNDILPNPTNQINTQPQINHECLESLSITIHNSNAAPNNILVDAPIDEFNGNGEDDYYENSENQYFNQPNCDDCANGVCDLDHLNSDEPFETQHDVAFEGNQINQSMISNDIEETTQNANNEFQHASDQLHNVRKSNEKISKKKTGHLIKRRTRQSALSKPIVSPTPSTSGVRSSTRKRISKKVFGDDQLKDDDDKRPKIKKPKSVQSNKSVKKDKQITIENADENIDDEDDGNDDQEEVKGQIVVLKLHCTEPGCGQTVTSRLLWREHMRNDHHKSPYHQLENNVQFNDREQTEYPCSHPSCDVISKTQSSIKKHWNRYHQPGKYKCLWCSFVANLHCKVQYHLNATHGSHECTDCGKKYAKISELKQHKRVHTGERPYKCTWKKCTLAFKSMGHAIRHVRAKHFNLPRYVKKQNELNIIDSRNAHDYIQKD